MAKKNKHGLDRGIPALTKRLVRKRCKFGCVLCRCGLYQYEHIRPFSEVKKHEVENICCLCATCHDAVTRGQISKQTVSEAYARVSSSSPSEVGAPFGPLDFRRGEANVVLGGVRFQPAIKSIIRHLGVDVLRVEPGTDEAPGCVTALFYDDSGQLAFRLLQNEWSSSPSNWDLEVVGARMRVRNPQERVVLSIRLDPPSQIVIETIDMRIGDSHVLVGEDAFAMGRYESDDNIFWMAASVNVSRTGQDAVGIDFTTPDKLRYRVIALENVGQSLATADKNFVIGSPLGLLCVSKGFSFGFNCALSLYADAYGAVSLDAARAYVRGDRNRFLEELRLSPRKDGAFYDIGSALGAG